MACETNIILAQEVFYWYSTQRYGFASAPISNGGYRFLFIIIGALELENISPYEEIASFGLGFSFGVVILGVIFTNRYAVKIAKLKLRLLEKMKK